MSLTSLYLSVFSKNCFPCCLSLETSFLTTQFTTLLHITTIHTTKSTELIAKLSKLCKYLQKLFEESNTFATLGSLV